ncbi:MAG: hypothetical protein Q7R95_05665 [bacterium]|nr:hypothetical protein [bacterium]
MNQVHQVLHSFCINPDVRFESQGNNEKVVLVVRTHPITLIGYIINFILMFIFLFIIDYFAVNYLNLQQMLFFNIFYFIGILSYIWFVFLNWFFNVGIVTTERVVDIDFISVLYKEISSARLNKVEDLTTRAGGYIESFFDFGDVHVLTAANEENVTFNNVPKPSEIIRIIDDLIGK